MARRKTLLQLLDEMEPTIRAAFLEAMKNIRDDVILADLVDAIRRRDIEAAVRAIPLGAEYLGPLDRALLTSYRDGGAWAAATFVAMAKAQGARVAVRFDVRNPRAERFAAEMSSRLVTEVLEETKESLRQVLVMGMRSGTAPSTAALDIVGRSPSPGKPRQGGIIGLRSDQIAQRDNVRAILSDPARVSEYFVKDRATGKLKPRYKSTDRRFDAKVKRAIREGTSVAASDVRALSVLHSNRLLRERGKMVARTELLSSLSDAQNEAMQQMIDRGDVTAGQVSSRWDSSEGKDTRPSHRAMDDQVQPYGQPFVSGDGFLLLYPGDRSLGAPAGEIINCRCARVMDVDFVAGLRRGD